MCATLSDQTVPSLFEIIHECRDLLVINKPPGLVCHPTKQGPLSSLIGRIRQYLGPDREAHLVNRLDRETSGLILVAKERMGARFLRGLWEQRRIEKTYHAVIHGHPSEGSVSIDAPLGRDESSPVAVKDCVRLDGAPSQTHVEVLQRFAAEGAAYAWVRVVPHTGRKHQIRIHLSHWGYPLVGDKLYGLVPGAYLDLCQGRLGRDQREALVLSNHALHASRLRLKLGEREVEMSACLNSELQRFSVAGGVKREWLPRKSGASPHLADALVQAICEDSEEKDSQRDQAGRGTAGNVEP